MYKESDEEDWKGLDESPMGNYDYGWFTCYGTSTVMSRP